MRTVTLGRTGLNVSAAGFGLGGHSRAGRSVGLEQSAKLVRAAFDAGINFFDTAAAYQTEDSLGAGLRGIQRGGYVISTKFSCADFNTGERISPDSAVKSLENSLKTLGTDYVDIFNIHALTLRDYDWAIADIYPLLEKAKREGKIRFIGVTEQFLTDTSHKMLSRALPDDLFDVIMVGYNILNQSAAKEILPAAKAKNLGVQCMFAVRSALHDPACLTRDIDAILAAGKGGSGLCRGSLDFLTAEGIASSLTEAAYRFCSHAEGIHVTLTGTGSEAHLRENINSINLPPLPEPAIEKLRELFKNADCTSGD